MSDKSYTSEQTVHPCVYGAWTTCEICKASCGYRQAGTEATSQQVVAPRDKPTPEQVEKDTRSDEEKINQVQKVLDNWKDYTEETVAEHGQWALTALRDARAELEAERKIHDDIAKICFEAGVSTDDGTSVSAVKNLAVELAKVRADRDVIQAENARLREIVGAESLVFGKLRCRYCGSDVIIEDNQSSDPASAPTMCWPSCTKCGMTGPGFSADEEGEAQAVKWALEGGDLIHE